MQSSLQASLGRELPPAITDIDQEIFSRLSDYSFIGK
jgi:hypothetical protein